jgi:hypothetical protein
MVMEIDDDKDTTLIRARRFARTVSSSNCGESETDPPLSGFRDPT